MTRFLPLLIGILVAAVCGRLGVWQLDRLGQRRARNAVIEAQMALPVLHISADRPIDRSTDRDRRAVVTGQFDFEHQIIVMARSFQGTPGVHVVTPLVVESTAVVLVERGWAPSPNAKDVQLDALAEPARTTVTGLLIEPSPFPEGSVDAAWPRHARSATPALLAGTYDLPVAPLVLRRGEIPAGVSPALRPVPAPELTNGPHLSYAVQWFSFALIALVGGGILAVKSGKR